MEVAKMKRFLSFFSIIAVVSLTIPQAHASLIVRGVDDMGNQLIYDTDFDITWYDFTNSGDTWYNQVNWADSLTVNFSGTTISDWRLPTALNQDGTGPCLGFNCTDNEMGHLYYDELGNSAGGPLNTIFLDGISGTAESFQNLLADRYWTGTAHTGNPDYMYNFYFDSGLLGDWHYYANPYYGIAVFDGDVIAAPESTPILLFASGLVVIFLNRRRIKKTIA